MNTKRILNVGCGNDTYGTDFIDLYPERKKVKKCNIDVDRFPYKDGIFDEVYSKNNFEHLRNPLNFLNESHRVLKKNGRLILITDNAGLWGLFGNVHHGGLETGGQHGSEDRHYSLFTTNHLANWLQSTGFRTVRVNYYLGEKHTTRNRLMLYLLTRVSERFHHHIIATGMK